MESKERGEGRRSHWECSEPVRRDVDLDELGHQKHEWVYFVQLVVAEVECCEVLPQTQLWHRFDLVGAEVQRDEIPEAEHNHRACTQSVP